MLCVYSPYPSIFIHIRINSFYNYGVHTFSVQRDRVTFSKPCLLHTAKYQIELYWSCYIQHQSSRGYDLHYWYSYRHPRYLFHLHHPHSHFHHPRSHFHHPRSHFHHPCFHFHHPRFHFHHPRFHFHHPRFHFHHPRFHFHHPRSHFHHPRSHFHHPRDLKEITVILEKELNSLTSFPLLYL